MNRRIDRALRFATKQHRGQSRESSELLPYVTHPVEVMLNLHWIGGVKDEEMLIAALCHDLLEETATQPDDLKVRFGKRVYDLVFELTRIEPLVEANWSKDRIWLVRADALLAEVTKMSPDAQVIKLADRLANTNEAHRFRTGKGLERYLWQSTRIMDAIPREQNPALWDALHTAIKR